MKKLNKEILQERSNEIHNFNYEIIGDYVNSNTKIKILHKECGNVFEQQPNNHLQGKGCMKCSGRDNCSVEKIQEKSNKKYNWEYLIIGKYINNITKISILHKICGNINSILPNNHFNGRGGCPICFGTSKKTKLQLQEESNKIHNNEYLIVGEYINTDTKIEIKHLTCGNTFIQTPDKHLHNNKCPICFGKNKLSKEILQERSNKKYNNEYTILGEYINSSIPILIKHNICGSEYLQVPNNHLKRKCFNCYGTPKKTIEEIQKISDKIHNSEYEILNNYLTSKDIITIRHKICGRESKIIAHSHTNGGKCKYCSISNGEKEIKNFLELNNIEHDYNISFDGCVYKNKLRFDFYLPNENMCIEYDGKQHFESIEWFGGQIALLESKKRDDIKNKYCKDNNINLIRISYKDNIENKLNEIFNIY